VIEESFFSESFFSFYLLQNTKNITTIALGIKEKGNTAGLYIVCKIAKASKGTTCSIVL
jgi:hypothetical protein